MLQLIGYIAAGLVFCTFAMRTMLTVRWLAIASNVACLAYAAPLQLWPTVILHSLLLPMNIVRLRQLYRMLASLRAAASSDIDVAMLLSTLRQVDQPAGTVLFRKNDEADFAYYIAAGAVDLPERQLRLGPGQFFGEVGVFGSRGVRTATAVCASAVVLYRISQRDLVASFHQSPKLAMALVRLIADRMADNLAQADAALARMDAHR